MDQTTLGLESLMVQEYLALKEKVAKLEKENADLKKAYAVATHDRDAMLCLLTGEYSHPTIQRREDGHVDYIYCSGSSVNCQKPDAYDQPTLDRIAKLIEEKTNNKEDK